MKNDICAVSNLVVRLPTIGSLYTPDRNRSEGVEEVVKKRASKGGGEVVE